MPLRLISSPEWPTGSAPGDPGCRERSPTARGSTRRPSSPLPPSIRSLEVVQLSHPFASLSSSRNFIMNFPWIFHIIFEAYLTEFQDIMMCEIVCLMSLKMQIHCKKRKPMENNQISLIEFAGNREFGSWRSRLRSQVRYAADRDPVRPAAHQLRSQNMMRKYPIVRALPWEVERLCELFDRTWFFFDFHSFLIKDAWPDERTNELPWERGLDTLPLERYIVSW